ncbi:ChbG/HpnK family deacetylase [Desulfovibrio sp. OttesenSCG-928-M16]|nr:ChbG/HpnK family deacetylase [Desulfovibrio sp. OttesenSCG-928-M16]
MTKYCIFNADDLGISPGVNAGILKAVRHGVVRSASLMVTMPYCEDAVRGVIHPTALATGLHFSITNGARCAGASDTSLLCNETGRFCRNVHYFFKQLLLGSNALLLAQIRKELNAQMAKMADIGIRATHFDSHQHIHMIPPIYDMLAEDAPRYGYKKCRFTRERLRRGIPWQKLSLFLGRKNWLKWLILQSICKKTPAPFLTPDHYWGVLSSGAVSLAGIMRFLRDIPFGGLGEVTVHVGTGDDDSCKSAIGQQAFTFVNHAERLIELDIVTSEALKQFLADSKIVSTTFSQIGL